MRRWDHLIPVNRGGETVLGNMVPACDRCDDSKRGLPFEEWMMSEAKWSLGSRGVRNVDQRVERIKVYMEHFGYTPRSLEARLGEHELQRLTTIRSRLQELRIDIEALIEEYRTTTENL